MQSLSHWSRIDSDLYKLNQALSKQPFDSRNTSSLLELVISEFERLKSNYTLVPIDPRRISPSPNSAEAVERATRQALPGAAQNKVERPIFRAGQRAELSFYNSKKDLAVYDPTTKKRGVIQKILICEENVSENLKGKILVIEWANKHGNTNLLIKPDQKTGLEYWPSPHFTPDFTPDQTQLYRAPSGYGNLD